MLCLMASLTQGSSIISHKIQVKFYSVNGPELDLLARQITDEPFLEGEEFCVINEVFSPKQIYGSLSYFGVNVVLKVFRHASFILQCM